MTEEMLNMLVGGPWYDRVAYFHLVGEHITGRLRGGTEMTIRYGFKPSGCFVVVDDDGSYWWAVAYATSPHAVAAKSDPIGTARRMAATKESDVWSLGASSKTFWAANRQEHAWLCQFATQAV